MIYISSVPVVSTKVGCQILTVVINYELVLLCTRPKVEFPKEAIIMTGRKEKSTSARQLIEGEDFLQPLGLVTLPHYQQLSLYIWLMNNVTCNDPKFLVGWMPMLAFDKNSNSYFFCP